MSLKHIIEIDNLVKFYKGSENPAVDGISLKVKQNEIIGILGPNGAGKTTIISILCGLIKKTSGNIKIAGFDIENELKKIKSIIGVVPQDIALYPSLTILENLYIFGNIYGMNKNKLSKRIDELLEVYGLEDNRKKKVNVFSGGMKRRLNLIIGILNNPEILFLDEPTVGIDVQSKNVIIRNLKLLNSEGTTMVYTSHYLEEAEQFCSDIVIIDSGKIIAAGTPDNLIDRYTDCKTLEDVYIHLTGHNLRD